MDRSKLRLDDDSMIQQRYISLLCEFSPSDLFSYLEGHDNYDLEKCILLCQKHKITDAEAYLLEM
jgi:hypothetical protein